MDVRDQCECTFILKLTRDRFDFLVAKIYEHLSIRLLGTAFSDLQHLRICLCANMCTEDTETNNERELRRDNTTNRSDDKVRELCPNTFSLFGRPRPPQWCRVPSNGTSVQ